MSDTRWKIRPREDGNGFVGEYGHVITPSGVEAPRNTIYGDTIADVMDSIAFHEGEQP